MLFVDYSSAFNTILPHKLVDKMGDLRFPQALCMWIRSFLSGRRQRVGHHTFMTLSLSTGSPQDCVLSPLLYSLYTHDWAPAHHNNNMVVRLSSWCRDNNLLLNTSKELIIDLRRKKIEIPPLSISGDCVEKVASVSTEST